MSKTSDQHIELSVVLEGENSVAFNNKYGWCGHIHFKVDCVDIESAKRVAKEILTDFDVVPHCNDAGMEEEIEEFKGLLQKMVDDVEDAKPNLQLTSGFSEGDDTKYRGILVEFKKSYEVQFG